MASLGFTSLGWTGAFRKSNNATPDGLPYWLETSIYIPLGPA